MMPSPSPVVWGSVQFLAAPLAAHVPLIPLSLPAPLVVLRTLMGHKANICSLDFHPYGEFVASGSQDTNIKVRGRPGLLSPTGWPSSAGFLCQGLLPFL